MEHGERGWLAVLQRIPPTVAAFVVLGSVFVAGGAFVAAFQDQADLPGEIAQIRAEITEIRTAMRTINQLDGLGVRLRMTEETLCTRERREEGGADRDRYCDVIEFIRANGLPQSATGPPNPTRP